MTISKRSCFAAIFKHDAQGAGFFGESDQRLACAQLIGQGAGFGHQSGKGRDDLPGGVADEDIAVAVTATSAV